MMRYLHWLARKDLALDQAMIPLGSCTMKLNAAAEMIPITGGIRRTAPVLSAGTGAGLSCDDRAAFRWLVLLTGYDAVCMQPNSGAQGEYAGLVTIRRYQESNGEGHRTICLIPESAHGTNPASAIWRDGGRGGGL
ncbi:hypothetical protein ACNKHW_18110 [Shigella flexneri]